MSLLRPWVIPFVERVTVLSIPHLGPDRRDGQLSRRGSKINTPTPTTQLKVVPVDESFGRDPTR